MTLTSDTPTTDAPEQVRHGRVVLNAVRFLADGPDAGDRPDQTDLGGTVTLIPSPRLVRWPTTDPPRLSSIAVLECPVLDGDLYPPGANPDALPAEPGVSLVASDQPDGEPSLIQWWASFRLTAGGRPIDPQPTPLCFEVDADETVDLALVVPVRPADGIVHVVSSADRLAAQAAATDARSSATTASTAAGTATAAATQAGQRADAAGQSAQAAALARDAAAGSASTAAGAVAAVEASATQAAGAASAATGAAQAASTAAGTATGAATSAGGYATAAASSATTAEQAATGAAQVAAAAAGSAGRADVSASDAAVSAVQAAEALALMPEGIRLLWVPSTEPWPPAPDPNPLHVYIRYWAPS